MMLFDEKQLKNHFDGDDELIGELVEVFEESYLPCLDSIKKALEESNHKDLELHAHTLKGMIANFFAMDLKHAAAELELMARNETISGPEAHIDHLSTGLPVLITELKSIV
jgi:HPt (histidine-containing phosphotransfer) domain-containing protein